jgi:hypothetical protein
MLVTILSPQAYMNMGRQTQRHPPTKETANPPHDCDAATLDGRLKLTVTGAVMEKEPEMGEP